jgi:hypothetical protein
MPFDLALLIPLGGMATGALVLVGVYKIWTRMWDHKHGSTGSDAAREELETLRRQVDGLEALPGRVAELEERVDFAERLLARQERLPLPGPE